MEHNITRQNMEQIGALRSDVMRICHDDRRYDNSNYPIEGDHCITQYPRCTPNTTKYQSYDRAPRTYPRSSQYHGRTRKCVPRMQGYPLWPESGLTQMQKIKSLRGEVMHICHDDNRREERQSDEFTNPKKSTDLNDGKEKGTPTGKVKKKETSKPTGKVTAKKRKTSLFYLKPKSKKDTKAKPKPKKKEFKKSQKSSNNKTSSEETSSEESSVEKGLDFDDAKSKPENAKSSTDDTSIEKGLDLRIWKKHRWHGPEPTACSEIDTVPPVDLDKTKGLDFDHSESASISIAKLDAKSKPQKLMECIRKLKDQVDALKLKLMRKKEENQDISKRYDGYDGSTGTYDMMD